MVMDEGDTLFEGGFDADMDAIVKGIEASQFSYWVEQIYIYIYIISLLCVCVCGVCVQGQVSGVVAWNAITSPPR